MKGRILGADAHGGTISGEDSKRYKFELTQWKGERSPSRDDEVDFEVGDDGRAEDIYPMRSTVDFGQVGDKMKGLLGDSASSPMGAQLIALATGNALFQISVAILIASFFFTFIKLSSAFLAAASSILPDNGTYTVFNIGDLIDYMKISLQAAVVAAEQLAKIVGTNPPLGTDPSQNPYGNPQAMAEGMQTMETITNFFYVLYLAPLGAAAVIVQLMRRQAVGTIAFLTGVACVASFIAVFAWRWAIISAVKDAGNADAAQLAGQAIHFGFGAYAILICGLLLVGAALGFVKLPVKS